MMMFVCVKRRCEMNLLDEFVVDCMVVVLCDVCVVWFVVCLMCLCVCVLMLVMMVVGCDVWEFCSVDGVGVARRRRASARERGIDDDARRMSVEM